MLFGGVLLARAEGESAGGTFFAGEGRRPTPPRKSGIIVKIVYFRQASAARSDRYATILDVTPGTVLLSF
jgi:hypothetical protein